VPGEEQYPTGIRSLRAIGEDIRQEQLATSGRREFEMTEDDLAALKEAGKSVPYMIVGGMEPMSPQDRANRAWSQLGDRMGFKYMTVQPVAGKSQLFFTAEPVEVVVKGTSIPLRTHLTFGESLDAHLAEMFEETESLPTLFKEELRTRGFTIVPIEKENA
jgi:hypothetical protein